MIYYSIKSFYQVSFHLVYPVDHPGIVDVEFDELVGKLDCAQPRQVLQYLMNTRYT